MRPIYLGAALAFAIVLAVGSVGLATTVTGTELRPPSSPNPSAFRRVVLPPLDDRLVAKVAVEDAVPSAGPTEPPVTPGPIAEPAPDPTSGPDVPSTPHPAVNPSAIVVVIATPRPTPAPTPVPIPRPIATPRPVATPRLVAAPAPTPAPVAATPTVADAKAYALSVLGSVQYGCIDEIFTRESGWNPYATNATSGAYGIPQALPGDKMAIVASDWRTNPVTQVKWGIGYVNGSYGSACDAWAFWQAHHWY